MSVPKASAATILSASWSRDARPPWGFVPPSIGGEFVGLDAANVCRFPRVCSYLQESRGSFEMISPVLSLKANFFGSTLYSYRCIVRP